MSLSEEVLPIALPLLGAAMLAVGAAHAIMTVRDPRSAVGWLGIIVLLPFVGALLYWMFGINRVQRRAVALLRKREVPLPALPEGPGPQESRILVADLARLIDQVTVRPLVPGNEIVPLVNGDECYPAMLRAIAEARSSVHLMTYIFDRDAAGMHFVDALAEAQARGVEVRVMVDAVGARYSFPTILRTLENRGIRVARFNPTILPWRWAYANLRNHRKICVIDGKVGFCGGINIRASHVIADRPRHPVLDLHFRVEGPVVAHMQRTFAEDWLFATRERLDGDAYFPRPVLVGGTLARGITDGPDIDIDKLKWAVLGAFACAHRKVVIATPYFLPESELVAVMVLARRRGVEVELLLSEKNNQALVKWACDAILPELLAAGCTVWKTVGPFDHSKVMVVDDAWVLLGSSNLDPRSLRLNFEFNIECHDAELARRVGTILDVKRTGARRVTHDELARAPWPSRFRNRLARLFVPYL